MSQIEKFIAFEAAVSLLKESGEECLLKSIYEECKDQESLPNEMLTNRVGRLYAAFTDDQISQRISDLVRPKIDYWNGELKLIFQKVSDLRKALPEHRGDWYFTGEYPTPGGYRVLNSAYINFYEQRKGRSY